MLLFGVSGTGRRTTTTMPKRIIVWLLLATTVNKIACDTNVSPFQLVRVTSDFAKVGRDHVTGEVSAEVRMTPEVVVQAFWSKVIWNGNDSAPTNNNSSHAISYYDVPITGDAWCTINDVVWVEPSWRHMTSSLKCRHLPNDDELSLILSLRSLDGAAQLRTPIRLFSDSPSTHNWLSPLVYPPTIQRPKIGVPLELGYSFDMRSITADVNFTVTLTMANGENDTENTIGLFNYVHPNISLNHTYNSDELTCTHITMGSTNTLRLVTSPFSPDKHGHRWVISVQLSNKDFSQALEYATDFLPKSQSHIGGIISPHFRRPPHRLHVRSCSGDVNRTSTSGREFHFRFRRPDCIVCEAMVGGWPPSLPPPPQMEISRVADGPSLGTEEAHSVFYHRVSYLTSALVFVVRSPADEYSGEYECVAGNGRTSQYESRIRFRIEVS